jgi:hypothetical protein
MSGMTWRVVLLAALPFLTAGNCGDNIEAVSGQLTLSWTVTMDGDPVDCHDVGAVKVELLSTLDGVNVGIADQFTCDDLEGVTGRLDPGSYSVVVSLLDADGEAIRSFPAGSASVAPGETTDLGTYDFTFESIPVPATVDLFVDFGEPGGTNCDHEEVIQEEVFVYEEDSGTCLGVAVTGTDQDGDPIEGNTCGTAMPCLEETVAQSFTLNTGRYEFEILGFRNGDGVPVLCYQFDAPQPLHVTGDVERHQGVGFNPSPEDEEACGDEPACLLPTEPCTGEDCCIGACTGTAVKNCTCIGPDMACEFNSDCCSDNCVDSTCTCSDGYCATMFDCCSGNCDLETHICVPT